MPPLRAEEEWARQVIETELGASVQQHDDGSRSGMHDLEVSYESGERAAVEVTAAVDSASTELWNIVNGQGRWVEPELEGGWAVHVKPSARRLRSELPPLLRALERSAIRSLETGKGDSGVDTTARDLGVIRAVQSGTEFPGSIYVFLKLPLDQVAGFSATSADALACWLGCFLRDDERTDVRLKLDRAKTRERHAFVIVSGLSGVPFSVTELLIREDAPVPAIAPDLPPEVTDAWVASTWHSGFGLRWCSRTCIWQQFSKRSVRQVA